MPKSDFYTRDNANNGIKMPLLAIDGSPTDEFLLIAGIDSDAFIASNAEAMRGAMLLAEVEDGEVKDSLIRMEKVKLVASLVKGWSFDEEATEEAVIQFFIDAPQVMDQVNQKAAQRSEFVKKK